MPRIKPFQGIRPNPEYAEQVVLHLENLDISQAKAIRRRKPLSFINMLVPQLDNRFLMGSKKELAFKKINENFEEFLEKGFLVREEKPVLYVYRIIHGGISQTGVWVITSIDDFLDNTLKKHELTRADRERSLIEYLEQTGIDANPVLITYPTHEAINRVIAKNIENLPVLDFNKDDARHQLWAIDSEADINELVTAFGSLQSSYIADGHHRAAAASLAGVGRRKLNLKHQGIEEYNFFTSVYMAADELRIIEFNRLVRDLCGLTEDDFLEKIAAHFLIETAAEKIKPSLHEFGMYLAGQWYKLTAKSHTYKIDNPVAELDVTILQNFIFSPILTISDPRTDSRLSFSGGIIPVEELVKQVDNQEFAAAFIVHPTSIDQLVRVADAGETMPPKSTWFEPKFLSGLVIHQIR